MSDRVVSVQLRADISQYSRELATAAAETQAFGRQTDRLGASGGPLQRTEFQSKRTGAEIDKLSGRLRLITDLALIGAPALTAMGAGAVGGVVALSAELGAAAGALGVTVLAVKGLGDGLKALDEYQLHPTTENLAKLNEQMDKIGPSGEHFVRFLDGIEPQLKSLQMAARDGLLPGAEEGISALLDRLPELRGLIRGIADELGGLSAGAGKALAGDRFDAFFEYLRTDGVRILDDTAKSAGNLAEVVGNLFAAFGGLSTDFSGGLLKFSQGLAEASANLDSSAGFQEFVSYIETEGPHALETLGSLANALLQIVEATAPLGGPVLTVLGKVADVFAMIADSDLGTPIFAGLAAMALFNRSVLVAQKLTSMTFGGPGVAILKGYTAGLRQVITARDRATMSAKELAAAEELQNKNLAGFAKFGKGAAVAGVLALSMSDVAQQTGLANTAMLSLAGPWGAAAGFALDLWHATDPLKDSIAGLNAAMDAGDIPALTSQIAAAHAELKKVSDDQQGVSFGEALLGPLGGLTDTEGALGFLTGKTSNLKDTMAAAADELAGLKDGSLEAFNPVHTLAEAILNAAGAADEETKALQGAVDAMRSHRSEALRAVDAHLNYRAAILDAQDALKKNGATVDENTRAGQDNLKTLHALAAGWNDQSKAAKNAKGSLQAAKDNFIDTAQAMNMPIDQAKRLADRLFEIPPKRKTQIEVETTQATAALNALKARMDLIHDKSVKVTVNTVRPQGGQAPTEEQIGGGARHHADGGTVPTTGRGYADRHLYLLADGEEVVSNRFGQADRHRALLKAINSNRMANGGTAGLDTPLFTGEGPKFYKAAYQHNKPFAVDPKDPKWPYQTALTAALELAFEDWANNNPVYFDPSSHIVDYDMRGFWKKKRPKGWHEGDHFPDTWKTPYDTTFSHESMYATKDNPFFWHGDKLIDQRNGQVIFASEGGTVPGRRSPYGDRVPLMAAPGEEIVSNRYGQADAYRAALKANSDTYTTGGGGSGDQWHVMGTMGAEVWHVVDGLKSLKAELAKSEKALSKEVKSRDDLQSQFDSIVSSVGGAYSSADPFAQSSGSGWGASKDPLAMFDSAVSSNTKDTTTAQDALAAAAANGLDGPLYAALAASGNLQLVQAFAGLSSSQIDQREKSFAAQSAAQAGLGGMAAQAEVGTQLVAANKELVGLREEVRGLRRDVKQADRNAQESSKQNARDVKDGVNGAAASGHRKGH